MSWDYDRAKRDNEQKLKLQIRDRLAPFVEAGELDAAMEAVLPVIADFAGQHNSIEERRRVREKRRERDSYPRE